MGIEIASSFTRKAAVPIDEGSVVADLTARDAIESGIRYEGLVVYVESEETNFQLVGGITNDDWEELSGSGSMGEFPTVSGIDERDAIPLEQRAWGKLFYDLQQLKYWYMPSGADLEDNDYWQALGKPVEWSYTFTGPSYGVSFGNDPIHYIRVDTDGGPQAVDLQNGKPQQIVFLKGVSDTDYPIISKSSLSFRVLSDIEIKSNVLVQLYWDDDESAWIPVGGVGVGGAATNTNHEQTNLVPNPRGAAASTADWEDVTYSAATKPSGTPSSSASLLTLTSEAGSLSANGSTRFKLSKASGNAQGQAVETIMPIPEGYQASVLSLDVLYKTDSADFIAGNQTDYSSLIFYCAQSSDGTNFTMLEPSSFRMLSKGMPDTLTGFVQVGPNTTHLKLIAYVSRTETGAWDVEFEASVSKASYAYGTIGTEFAPVTMTLTNAGNATIVGFEKRVDDVAYYMAKITIGSTLPTGIMLINLPSGRTINADKINVNQVVGDAWGVKGTFQEGSVIRGTPTSSVYITSQGGSDAWNATTPAVWAAEDFFTVNFSVPIQGWSFGAQLADGYDGRVIAAHLDGSTTVIANSATHTPLQFTSIVKDTTGRAATGTANAYKIPSSGFYRITGGYTILGVSRTTTGWLILNVLKNGSSYGPHLNHVDKPGEWYSANGSTTLWFNADEIVGLGVNTTNGNATTSLANAFLQIERVPGSAFMSPTAIVAARCINSSTQSISNYTSATLNANTIMHDTHGILTLGSPAKATISEAGLYELEAQVDVETRHQTAFSNSQIVIQKNGLDNLGDHFFQVATDEVYNPHHNFNVSGEAFLNEDDEITVVCTNNSGNTATVKLKSFTIRKVK